MNYKNKIILTNQLKNNHQINEQFNEWLSKDEYYIIDIDELAKDLGRIIINRIKKENLPKDDYTINRLTRPYVCDTLLEIQLELNDETKEFIYNNIND